MGLAHSPRIVTDGLLFYYDMNNSQKSWRGKPTTNLHTNTSTFGGWTLNVATIDTVGGGSRLTETGTTGGPFTYQDRTVVTATTYTESIEAKADLRYVLQITPSTGFSNNTLYTNFNLQDGTMSGTGTANSTITYLGDGWYRCTYTSVSTLSGSARFVYGIAISPSSTRLESVARIDGYGIFIRKSQLEASTFATPFVDGTRSNTQAILDLTNNNTVTASSLTYSSDNTFSFNGSSNYLTTPLNIGSNPLVSVNMWVKRTASFTGAGYWGLGGGSSNNGINGYTSVANKIGWDLWGQTTFHTGVDYPLDQWVNVCWVKTGSTFTTANLKIYINGVDTPLSTTVRNNSSTVNITSGLTIGRLTTALSQYYAPGIISVVSLYDRVLSASEVLQNFNAQRGRFGI